MNTWAQKCDCGRTFDVPQAYTTHKRSCAQTKKRLSSALSKARDALRAKKRQKLEGKVTPSAEETSSNQEEASESAVLLNYKEEMEAAAQIASSRHEIDLSSTPLENNDLDQSLAVRRPRRENRQVPIRYRDIIPSAHAALPPQPHPSFPSDPSQIEPTELQSTALVQMKKWLRSTHNIFGLFRQYYAERFPEHDPDSHQTLEDLMDAPLNPMPPPILENFEPYPTYSSFLLGEWYWNDGTKKSQSSFKNLLKIVGDPRFRPEDVANVNWNRIDTLLGGSNSSVDNDQDNWEDERDGDWSKTAIRIKVPFHKRMLRPGQEDFVAGTLHHRKLVPVIREKLSRPSFHPHLHLEPYELLWQPNEGSRHMRVYGELYTSDCFIEAHRALQNSPPEPGCELPRYVVGLMFASDGTQLTAFSDAKLWPLYLALGNESKYRRSKPTNNAFEHIAYFEKLPDSFKAFAAERTGGKGPNSVFMAHCSREIYDAQWEIILDDEFLDAYAHGIVIDCCDNIRGRFYPRIFTYSADYREKILISSVRNLGNCPCVRCKIPMDRVPNMGKPRDMAQRKTLARVDDEDRRHRIATARDNIYEKKYSVNSTVAVNALLQRDSLVPTANAFSTKLSQFGFNLFSMLVVDLMHEIELGVWKAIFIHLLRILDCHDEGLKNELDRRFRAIPPFGRDAIRKIWSNRSELKKMTAHDYEDMLQCAIPVFDGLLPEPHNTRILKLLFELAHWHALAKLRMHTDATRGILLQVTSSLGKHVQEFQEKTCSMFQTRELERERAARNRRQEKNTANNDSEEQNTMTTRSIRAAGTRTRPAASNSSRIPKQLNLNTYTYHSIGDYAYMILRYGTTDSYTTQPSELEHRSSKGRFPRTSGRQFVAQLTKIERRQRMLRAMREQMDPLPHPKADFQEQEELENNPHLQYNIGKTQNSPLHIPTFLRENHGDPAVKNFFPKLRRHLLPRIQELHQQAAKTSQESSVHSTFSFQAEEDCSTPDIDAAANPELVYFKMDRIYRHKSNRFHFTTYDVRRGTDVLRPDQDNHNIMLLAENDQVKDTSSTSNSHHFLYARVIGVYHANVVYAGPGMCDYEARRLEFLWVRWYEVVDPASSGWSESKLDSVRFPPMSHDDSFGFVDPRDVLRCCHVLPNFAKGKRHPDGAFLSRRAKDKDDYHCYYIGRFSERDLLMRYHWGLGVGHAYAHNQGNFTSDPFPQENIDLLTNEETEECDGLLAIDQTQGGNGSLGADDVLGDSDDPDLDLEDRQREGWDDVESEDEPF